MWENGGLKTFWRLLWHLSVGLQLLRATPLPENPFEALSMGAMSIAGQAAEIFQNGAALHKEGGMETGLFKVHSKTAVGMGDAMRPKSDSDVDSDEDDRRRRKRAVKTDLHGLRQRADALQHPHLHRGKRSPCHTGSGGGGGTGGGTGAGTGGTGVAPPDYPTDYNDVVERKRRQRKAARRRAAKKSGKKTRSRTKKLTDDGSGADRRRRRRRQVEVDLTPTVDGAGKKISKYAKQFTEKVRGVWESVVTSMKGAVEKVKQTIGGGGGANGGQDGAAPEEVEFI